MSLLIYHAISNGYDKPKPVSDVGQHVDYQIIAGAVSKSAAATWNRYHKIFKPPEWREFSLYLDGHIGLAKPALAVWRFVEQAMATTDVVFLQHPERKCAFVEIEACVHKGKISKEQAEVAHEKLHNVGLPKNYGLWACGIIMRRGGVAWLQELQKRWFEIYLTVGRDQIALPAAMYQMRKEIPTSRLGTLEMNVFNNPVFTFGKHR